MQEKLAKKGNQKQQNFLKIKMYSKVFLTAIKEEYRDATHLSPAKYIPYILRRYYSALYNGIYTIPIVVQLQFQCTVLRL